MRIKDRPPSVKAKLEAMKVLFLWKKDFPFKFFCEDDGLKGG